MGGDLVRAGILTLGGFMALRELLLAPEIVTLAFALAFGAISVAGALAFGLGGRAVAERMTRRWYDRSGRPVGEVRRPDEIFDEDLHEPPVH
jgi:hypothetical protein